MNRLERSMFHQTWAAIEKYAAANPRPEWVNEVERLISANRFPEAQQLAKQHAATADKMWKIKPLGKGLDAVTYLTVGNIPRAKEQPGVFVTKFLGDSKYPNWTTKKLLQDRAAVDKALGPLIAKNYGRYVGAGGKGGVEFQEFMPRHATPTGRNAVQQQAFRKPRVQLWPGRYFGDLHNENIRADAAGNAKIIDARFDRLNRPRANITDDIGMWRKQRSLAGKGRQISAAHLPYKKHWSADAKVGLEALKDLRMGKALSVKAPGFFADALRSPPYLAGAAGLALLGGTTLASYLADRAEKRRLQNTEPLRV